MKTKRYFKKGWMMGLGLASVGVLALGSCTEEINTDNRYTFTGETVGSYLQKHDTLYSQYYALTNVVKQSPKTNSVVANLLTTRGNYTCFAPTNEAINAYLDSMYQAGKFASRDFAVLMDSAKAGKHMGDSLAKVIVYNSIIDCGMSTAYEAAVFPVDNGAFPLANMNDRYLTASSKTVNGKLVYTLLGNVDVIQKDIEVENGYIHGVNRVVAPTSSSVSDLFAGIKNMQYFGELVHVTGWEDSLRAYRDEEYEEMFLDMDENNIPNAGTQDPKRAFMAEHRLYGFTVFAETDDVFKKALELKGNENFLEKLNEYLKKKYDGFTGITFGTDPEELKKPTNAINQFVAYHLLGINLPSNQLVYHYSEKDFDLDAALQGNIQITIPVFEIYETMSMEGGPRRLLKIYESKQSGGKRLNRNAKMDNDTYQEESVKNEGVLIDVANSNAENNTQALNGVIYPIKDMLVYTKKTEEQVFTERLRFDAASMIPELINLGYRRPMAKYANDKSLVYFPPEYKLENFTFVPGTNIFYSAGFKSGWDNYQGDEVIITGNYDVTMKLPPVPFDGTYEIRYGIQGNTQRGMCQVYFGEEGVTPTPVDIPMDLRMHQYDGLKNFNVGWEEATDDKTFNEEVNKNLRNNKWMKGPKYFKCPTRGQTAYEQPSVVRKLLTTKYMEAGKTYYLRFKSALDNPKAEFYFDYIEIVPSEVYASTSNPEDEW